MAVSPFDGFNRIRFKGSPNIADCRLNFLAQIGKRKIGNRQRPDSQPPCGSPETYLIFKLSKGF